MSEPVKLWKGSKKQANLMMSLRGREHCIQIAKDVVRVLGAPAFVSIKVNPQMDSILIVASDERQPMSFKVPEDICLNSDKKMVITSISFVLGIMVRNELDLQETYRINGIYSEPNNAVVFALKDATMYIKPNGGKNIKEPE